ncbi:TGS domain-containing protein [Rummeliibacillus stabekisii]|uniref:TGS domain-containing protein n=1 Tax=Rummeliibacillus stabekisii TaxID=241244 RepID=UPI0037155F0F
MMNDQFIQIQFPDGKQQQYERGVTLTDIAHSISPSLSKKTIVGYVNGIPTDVARPITEDAQISLYDAASKEGIAVVRHSTAHLLAHALKRIYPSIHFGVGPVIENGFYYDVELDFQSDLHNQ